MQAGETVGLVGESGSGKSMTGMSILRLLPATGRIVAGSVKFNGQELTTLDEKEMRKVRGNKIAIVFQDPDDIAQPHDDRWRTDRRAPAGAPGPGKGAAFDASRRFP